MKKIVVVAIAMMLSGCVGTSGVQLLNTEGVASITSDMTDRFTVSGAVEQTRLVEGSKAIVAEADARKAEAEARKVEAINNPQPQLIINDAASMTAYKDAKFAEAMQASMEMAENNVKYMAEALKAIAGDKGSFALFLKDYKLPQGVIAESFDSLFGGVAKIADTPAALVTSVGVAAVGIAKHAKANNVNSGSGAQNVEGSQTNGISESGVASILEATGSGATTTSE